MPGPTTHSLSKNLWFRVAVPERLREKVGKREIKFSLGTSDPAVAKIRQAQELARWRARFLELDRQIEQEALSRAPALVDTFLEAMAQRNGDYDSVVYGIQKFVVLRLFSAWGQEEFTDREADRAFAFMPNRAAWRAGDLGADADLIPDEDREETLARVLMLNRSRDTQGLGFSEVLQRLLRAGRWRVLDIEVAMVADHADTEIAVGSALFDAVAEQLLRRLVYHVPRHVDEKVARYFSRVEPVPAVAAAPEEKSVKAPVRPAAQPQSKSRRSLSVAAEKWLELRAPRPQSSIEAKRAVSRFIDIHGDLPVGAITREHILEYRDVISRIPKNVNLEKLKASGGSLRELARSALDPSRRLSPGAVRKDVGVIAAILALVRNEGWIDDNVATGIVVAGYSKTRQRQRTPRLPLRRSMMETLFASPLFTGCAGRSDIERTRPGEKVYQDALYWTFLFGATAGPRLEEIGQVRLDDIEIIPRPQGQPTVAIYVTGTEAGESIKNDESARVIVVHPRLLDLGFLEYVEKRRAAKAERLFDLKQSATGKWTKELSRRVNRYVDRVVTDDPRYVFHSMRHEFKDRAEETISTRVHDRITGHTPATVGGRYGVGASAELIAREIEKLDLSFVDWRRLSKAAGRQASSTSSERVARPQDGQARLPGF
jgi:integrase